MQYNPALEQQDTVLDQQSHLYLVELWDIRPPWPQHGMKKFDYLHNLLLSLDNSCRLGKLTTRSLREVAMQTLSSFAS